MNLFEEVAKNEIRKTGLVTKLSVPNMQTTNFDVYAIPLKYLYYNDHNGRINTAYKQYQAEHGSLTPERGDSKYNEIFKNFIYNSNSQSLEDTLISIKEKTQQVPGVVLGDGRVIDGNRRFTALRKLTKQTGLEREFNAVILDLDSNSKIDEKRIKELELDLQLGREEKVNYNPIDRIFDVYNTIEIQKLMTIEEYKKASGAGNTRGINRDLRLAKLISRFIEIISPGGNVIDKFYLARDLDLDGPIEEIEGAINKISDKDGNKEAVTDAALTYLAIAKTDAIKKGKGATIVMRELKNHVINKPNRLNYFLDASEDVIDDVIETFEAEPVRTANDLQKIVDLNPSVKNEMHKLVRTTSRIIHKSENESKRTGVLDDISDIRDSLLEIKVKEFKELTADEMLDVMDMLKEIQDILHRLKRDI